MAAIWQSMNVSKYKERERKLARTTVIKVTTSARWMRTRGKRAWRWKENKLAINSI